VTWSIVARDSDGAFGVAVASRFFAVGAHCPHGRAGIGVVSTQALVNPHYGPKALDLLSKRVAAAEVVARVVGEDEGRDHRQLHLVDGNGTVAAHTGKACIDWCGQLAGEAFSVAGNMLAGPAVLEATAEAFRKARGAFGERLIAALAAGDAAGGDKRGKQAAALLVYTSEDYPFLDIRVDDHAEPLVELRRLYQVSLERYQPFVRCLPSRARPAGITDRALIEDEIARSQRP